MQIGRAVQTNVLAGQSRLGSKSSKQQHARADGVLVSGATLDYARTCGCKEAMSSKPSKHSKRSKQIHQEATRLASRLSKQQHARTRAVNILAQFIGHWKKMTRQVQMSEDGEDEDREEHMIDEEEEHEVVKDMQSISEHFQVHPLSHCICDFLD